MHFSLCSSGQSWTIATFIHNHQNRCQFMAKWWGNHITLQAGPFSISSQSTSWHLSVKSEHYEQNSQQIIEACHLTCQLGTLTEVRPLEFDNVKYARGYNQYFFIPYQLNQGREFMHASCKALTSEVYAVSLHMKRLGKHWTYAVKQIIAFLQKKLTLLVTSLWPPLWQRGSLRRLQTRNVMILSSCFHLAN